MTLHPLVNAGLFLSLGLDTFAVAIGLGLSGVDGRARLRAGFAFAAAEGVMPLAGFLLGNVLARAVGAVASYLAIGLLFAVGAYALWEATRNEDHDYHVEAPLTLLVLALSVSMDELAVGFSLGLLHVPVLLAVDYIALQAFILTLVGIRLGGRLGAVFAERAELISGVALIGLAVLLLVEKQTGM